MFRLINHLFADLVDEQLVGKDSNGFSLEHALVSDANRSLIQELIDFSNKQRIMREKRRRRDESKPNIKEFVDHDIDALISDQMDRKDDQKKINISPKRKMIDYTDLDRFE